MTREEKANIIDELSEKLQNNQIFYIADASGLDVAQINKFRRMCYNQGVELKVYKNTLIRKALEKSEFNTSEFDEVLKGYSGLMFSGEVANTPAKIIRNYRKKEATDNKPLLKAASIESELYIGDEHLKTLSELKSKEELIGEIISLLQSPAKNVLSALVGSKDKLAGIVKTLQDREEDQSEK